MVASGEAEGPPSDRPDGAAPGSCVGDPPRDLSCPRGGVRRLAAPLARRLAARRARLPSRARRTARRGRRPSRARHSPGASGRRRPRRPRRRARLAHGPRRRHPAPPEPSSSSAVPSSSEGVFVRGPASSSSTRVGVSNNPIFSNGPKSTPYPGERASTGGAGDGKDSPLRRLFNLPDHEQLLEEYLCALYKKILLQGRMYLFTDHVCFYSNVFGYTKIKTIALKDVTIVKRAYTAQVVFNAVEIVHKGKCEFFTSFIFPDKHVQNHHARSGARARGTPRFCRPEDARGATTSTTSTPRSISEARQAPEVAAMLGVSAGANEARPRSARSRDLRRPTNDAHGRNRRTRPIGGVTLRRTRPRGTREAPPVVPRATMHLPARPFPSPTASVPSTATTRRGVGDEKARRPNAPRVVPEGARPPRRRVGEELDEPSAPGREETDDATGATESAEDAGRTPSTNEASFRVGGVGNPSPPARWAIRQGFERLRLRVRVRCPRLRANTRRPVESALSSSTIAAPLLRAGHADGRRRASPSNFSCARRRGSTGTLRVGVPRERGETNVRATKWSRHRHHGHARDIGSRETSTPPDAELPSVQNERQNERCASRRRVASWTRRRCRRTSLRGLFPRGEQVGGLAGAAEKTRGREGRLRKRSGARCGSDCGSRSRDPPCYER